MQKRGQLTVFIILGLVVLVIAGIFFYLSGSIAPAGTKGALETRVNIEQLSPEAYVQHCVDQTASKALFYFGFIGGDVNPDPNPFYFRYDDNYMIPYYYYKGKSLLPSLSAAEQKYLSAYMDTNVRQCLDWTKMPNVQAEMGDPTTTTTIGTEDVTFSVAFPITISQTGQSRQLEPLYTTRIKVRLQEMLSIAKTIVDKEVEDDLYIHWDYLTEVGKRDYNITAYTEADETIVYRMLDLKNSLYENKPYVFQWANKIKTVEP